MPSVAYYTLGCKINQYETEKIREELELLGFSTVSFSQYADIYIINTCSVTSVADSKSRAIIRKAIKQNKSAFVIVTGCYSNISPLALEAIDGVDLIIPNEEKETIAKRLSVKFNVNPSKNLIPKPRSRTRAVVKIQDGCDNFCSYCVIPYARNIMSKRDVNSVIDELKLLADFGYKEIVFTGIRLGKFSDENSTLTDLVNKACDIEQIKRVRLSSIEPWEIDDNLLNIFDNQKVCRHLHIPLQSGDDKILMLMNRKYTSSEYLKLIEKIKSKIPDIGITTDVIVGFPFEDDAAFQNTINTVKKAMFSRLHVFRFSKRPKTKAKDMPNQVSSEEKQKRAKILSELDFELRKTFASQFINKNLSILVEAKNKVNNTFSGFTDNYISAELKGSNISCGEIVDGKVLEVENDGSVFVEVC